LKCSKSFLKKHLPKKDLKRPIHSKKEYFFNANILNRNRISPLYNGKPIPILFEDDNIIALNKPTSIHGHPLTYLEADNCLSFLREKNKFEALFVSRLEAERGMLYRLDFLTSGVLVFCKKDHLLTDWRENFFQYVKKKQYLAVVDSPGPDIGTYQTFLKPFGPKGAKMVEGSSSEGLSLAKLKIIAKESSADGCLLRIELITGVRHQIRSQLESLGFPIKGDTLYGGSSFSRLMLHAYEYEFSLHHSTDSFIVLNFTIYFPSVTAFRSI